MNLRQLSQILALSPTTVSRTLNDYPEVNEVTRARVLLATGRAMVVGHVILTTDQHEMMNPEFSDFIADAGKIYSQHGYDMVLSAVPNHEQERSYRQMKSHGSVDGIIVHRRATGSDLPHSWIDVNSRRPRHCLSRR